AALIADALHALIGPGAVLGDRLAELVHLGAVAVDLGVEGGQGLALLLLDRLDALGLVLLVLAGPLGGGAGLLDLLPERLDLALRALVERQQALRGGLVAEELLLRIRQGVAAGAGDALHGR